MLPLCVPNLFLQPESPLLAEPTPTGDGRTVTLRIPISIRRRGGRKLVPRTRRHTQYRGGTQPSDRQRSRRTRTTAPWSRQSPGRSALAIVRPSNACFQPVFLTLDLVPSTRPASICP